MLQDISAIRIKGANFSVDTELSLFDHHKGKHRMQIIYGKNGAGKSTIAKAFLKIKGIEEPKLERAELLDKEGNIIILESEEKKQIAVFNEKFIDDNIRFNSEGLDTIVVIGEQKDVDDKINEAKQRKDIIDAKLLENEEKYKKYLDKSNQASPIYYELKLVENLKGDHNWAGRDKEIHNKKQNTRVTEDTYQKFINRKPVKSRDELLVDFAEYKKQYEEAKNGTKKIEHSIKTDIKHEFEEIEVQALLKKKIEKPQLSDREKYLLSIVETKGHQHLIEIKNYFENEENKQCPYCLQEVSEDYTEKLLQGIVKILSKESEEHLTALRLLKTGIVAINLDEYKILDSKILDNCYTSIEAVNVAITKLNELIEQKINCVFEPIEMPKLDIADKYKTLLENLSRLEENRKCYNRSVVDTSEIVNALKNINDDIAYYDIVKEFTELKKQKKAKLEEDKILSQLKGEQQNLRNEIQALEARKSNIDIAMDKINNDLRYIFFQNGRLALDYRDGKYVLLSRGHSVTPEQISIGERNAIALCYFFNNLVQNKTEKEAYKSISLLIVDDPVSSFDRENKVGILSYLKFALSKFIEGCVDTKVVVMTHDLQIMFDIFKLSDEITKACDRSNPIQGRNRATVCELINRNIQNIKMEKRQEYSLLLEEIYDFGLNANDDKEVVIGNMMRRALEAYGSFCYKQGIAEISSDHEILAELEEPFNRYFENLMYRLILNGESHLKEQVQTINDINFFEFISLDEKQRTARDIICLIYKLNKLHLLKHLASKKDASNVIEGWCGDIEENSIS